MPRLVSDDHDQTYWQMDLGHDQVCSTPYQLAVPIVEVQIGLRRVEMMEMHQMHPHVHQLLAVLGRQLLNDSKLPAPLSTHFAAYFHSGEVALAVPDDGGSLFPVTAGSAVSVADEPGLAGSCLVYGMGAWPGRTGEGEVSQVLQVALDFVEVETES